MAQQKSGEYPTSADGYDVFDPAIGHGGFSTVYRAKVKATRADVAIKLVSLEELNSNLEDLRKEIMIMRQLKHPNVVSVYTAFVDGDNLWIIMPLLLGGSAAAIIKRTFSTGFKDEALLATILKEALLGLAYFHKDGLVHRDIKAGNILISANGDIQLADFGVAGRLEDEGKGATERRTFTGTPCWMAPEVMEQTKGYNCSADIWSFGITAMELAFGSAPYASYAPMKVLLMTLSEPPPTLAIYQEKHKFSDSFKKLIAACLVKDPKKRPSAAALLKKDFFKKAVDKESIKKHLCGSLPEIPMGALKTDFDSAKEGDNAPEGADSWCFDVEVKALVAMSKGSQQNSVQEDKEDGEGENVGRFNVREVEESVDAVAEEGKEGASRFEVNDVEDDCED